jgi:hypothetical protein
MADNGWHRTFDDPIPLPDGRELRTLRDAGNFIAKLPKAEHDAPEWESGHPSLDAGRRTPRGYDAASHRHHESLRRHHQPPEPTPRKKRAKKHRVIR